MVCFPSPWIPSWWLPPREWRSWLQGTPARQKPGEVHLAHLVLETLSGATKKSGNSRIPKWMYHRYRRYQMFGHISLGDSLLHRPYGGLIYGRYLQLRIQEWLLANRPPRSRIHHCHRGKRLASSLVAITPREKGIVPWGPKTWSVWDGWIDIWICICTNPHPKIASKQSLLEWLHAVATR